MIDHLLSLMSRVQCRACLNGSAELNSADAANGQQSAQLECTTLHISGRSVHLQVSVDLHTVGQWTDVTNSTVALSLYAGDRRLMSCRCFWNKIGFEVHKGELKWTKRSQRPTGPPSPNVALNTLKVFAVFSFPSL